MSSGSSVRKKKKKLCVLKVKLCSDFDFLYYFSLLYTIVVTTTIMKEGKEKEE